jgi:putative hydrolase of the HAD superfamily
MNDEKSFTLVFDWGNTLMQVLDYPGPMAEWPEVAAVDGALEALSALEGRFPLAVATNAGDSQPEQVRAAFERVGMGRFFPDTRGVAGTRVFTGIFTAAELKSAKPSLRFFREIETRLGRPSHQLVMIGDDYRVDVLGAKSAGWRAVWYNPRVNAAPGLLPLQDAEIARMAELPDSVSRLASAPLPDYPTCLYWLAERDTPYNLLAHIQLVASIAYQLAVWLRQRGEPVDPVLTHRGAMLHDLAKMESIRLGKERGKHIDHAALARDILARRAQPVLAEIADRHMLHQSRNDPRYPRTWEEKLVHFADKLAEGSHLASLEERVQALMGRYPTAAAEIQASQPLLLAQQEEICQALGITGEEMMGRLRKALGMKSS